MLIKVCGLRDLMNIEEIASLAPDYMGFIFYKKSPRFVGDLLNPIQLQHLDSRIKRTGVFVDALPREISEQARKYFLHAVQLHGDEPVETVKEVCRLMGGVEVIKAFRVDEAFDFSTVAAYEDYCSLFLFDAAGDAYGGNGTSFCWDLLKAYTGSVPFLLAGGIGLENLSEALAVVSAHPLGKGIDVSSSIEIRPGVKSVTQAQRLIQKVRGYGLE